jgi:hypothetical protein
MMKELLTLPSIRKHDTRFAHEVALVSPGSELAQVTAIVEKHLGPALKPAGVDAPSEGLAARESPLVRAIGGLRNNQTLYAEEIGAGLSIYVAFWPWSGGSRFTIKVGVHELASG